MDEKSEQEATGTPFKSGDKIINVHPASLHHGRRGVFLRYWDVRYTFHKGRACDVEYEGVVDLYGRVETAQSEGDLELVEE